ncbi:hypothetical protein GCM10023176_23580 [Micromonospora coerulea]|uniref:Uncharacterized protein n=1 Tax=Micromonospora coerulea TaxID=47856 RepID=A0ABP8SG86_9ACTN
MASRSVTAPATPVCGKSRAATADPNCTDSAPPSTSPTAPSWPPWGRRRVWAGCPVVMPVTLDGQVGTRSAGPAAQPGRPVVGDPPAR